MRSVAKRIGGGYRNLVVPIGQRAHGGASTYRVNGCQVHRPCATAISGGGIEQIIDKQRDGAISFGGARDGGSCIAGDQVAQHTGITTAGKRDHRYGRRRCIHDEGKCGAVAGHRDGAVAIGIDRRHGDDVVAIGQGFQKPAIWCVTAKVDRPGGRLKLVLDIQSAGGGFIKGCATVGANAGNGQFNLRIGLSGTAE